MTKNDFKIARCVVYNEDDLICRKLATVYDPVRCEMVCEKHAPEIDKSRDNGSTVSQIF